MLAVGIFLTATVHRLRLLCVLLCDTAETTIWNSVLHDLQRIVFPSLPRKASRVCGRLERVDWSRVKIITCCEKIFARILPSSIGNAAGLFFCDNVPHLGSVVQILRQQPKDEGREVEGRNMNQGKEKRD